ncbi:MAG: hypothetical protein QOJ12_443, partial [Thermoleophilales bacterium]|nr:hypothetical protein [Thermoleophilales bacterium]
MTATVAPSEPAAGVKRSPFVGLEPYSEDDAEFFFGREREKRIITSNLRAARLTLFYGSSGVGKSSVLRAGVVHDLHARVGETGQSSAHSGRAPFSITYFNSWRDARPLGRLMEQIRTSAVEALGGEPLDPWDGISPATETLHAWTGRVRKLLVVLDQFEEYFLYHPDETGPGTFRDEFPRIVNDRSLHVNFMLSIREDAWAKLDRFKGAIPDLFSNYLRLGHLDHDAARRAIEGPIEEYNRRYGGDGGEVGIEPALVDSVLAGITSRTLLGDARASGGAEGDAAAADGAPREHGVETPYLQLVIDRLWEATRAKGERLLTDATLTELGGPAEIVRGHLERAMEGLTPDDQDIAADSFRFLVTSSKTKVAQRVSDLADWTGHDEGDVSRVLERLSSGYRYRILRPLPPPPGEDSERFELFHDVLADPVLAWRRRFRKDRDAEVLAKRIEQEDQKRLEAERGRHRRQVRRIKIAGAVVVAILAVGLGTALVFIYQQKAARSRTLASAAIGQVDRDPELALLLAREAWGEKHTARAEEALRRALGASLVRRRIPTGGAVLGALPDRSGRSVLTRASDHLARWSIADGRQLGRPVRLGGELVSDASADGGTAIAANARATVIWPTASKSGPLRVSGGAHAVSAGADGRYAAAVDAKRVRIWDTRRLQQPPVVVMQRGNAPLDYVWLDPRGRTRFVGVSCGSGTAEVVNWRSGARVQPAAARGQRARRRSDRITNGCNAALSPDGRLVATAVLSPIARIWDARTGGLRGEVRGDRKGIEAFSWRPDSAKLALAGGKEARIVDAGQSPRLTRVLASARDWVFSTRWSADGGRLVTASNDGTATVFDMQTGNKLFDLRGHGNSVNSAEFVGSTYKVVTGSSDGTVRLWDTGTGRELSRLGDWALEAAYSPKDRRVAIAATGGPGSFAPVAMIWDPATGKHVGLYTFGVAQAQTVGFDNTGARLLVGGDDGFRRGVVEIVDPATGDATPAPGTFPRPAQTARFSPDGSRIAVAMDYGLTVVELSKGAAGQQ